MPAMNARSWSFISSVARDAGLGERRHVAHDRGSGTQERHRKRGPRAFTQPEIEVEQGARTERGERMRVPTLGGAMGENNGVTNGGIDPACRQHANSRDE